jgi:hypothetical protein
MCLDGFEGVVATAWHSVDDADPFRRLTLSLQATVRGLTSWSARTVRSVRDKLAISRVLLLKLDRAQEDRTLSLQEEWLREEIKRTYLGTDHLEGARSHRFHQGW